MALLAGSLLVLLILYAVPAYREYVGGLILVTFVVLVSFYVYERKQMLLAERVVSLSEIEVSEISLYGPIHPFVLKSTLKNNSRHVVEKIDLSIVGYQCPASFAKLDGCEVIGESIVALEGEILPGNTRQYDTSVSFDHMRAIEGEFVWQYEISKVRSPLRNYTQPYSPRTPPAHLSNTPR